jgi:hypothetical protein
VHDDTPSPDAFPSDAVLRLDTFTGELRLVARVELSQTTATLAPGAIAHFRGRLYVGQQNGSVAAYRMLRNDTAAVFLGASAPIIAGQPVRALTIDRTRPDLYAATPAAIVRAPITGGVPGFTLVGSFGTGTGQTLAMGFSGHYGTFGGDGLYALRRGVDGQPRVEFVPSVVARGLAPFAFATHALPPEPGTSALAPTACGRMLLGSPVGASMLRESVDTRLSFDSWAADEFAQGVTLARGLLAPDGEPAGWVIDADVIPSWSRFHPATPDAAAWAVLVLMASQAITGQSELDTVRSILERYAGLAPDGIAPGLSADGVFRHWCDPFSATGAAKPGWPAEFATLSTMKIAWAASRAKEFYPAEPGVRVAADRILSRLVDPASYLAPGSGAVYLVSAGTGPNTGTPSGPFNEALLFVDQAADLDPGPSAVAALARWLDRTQLPSATFLTGQPITGDVPGQFLPAFASLYPLLAVVPYASDPAWQGHVRHLAAAHAAWTDDVGPRHRTVFSAGATKPEWGGYHADNLGDFPGEVTSFPSLLAFAATGSLDEPVAAYRAYRVGARQTLKTGATLLTRRSNVDPAWGPTDSGLADVSLGTLGLAEMLSPGVLDAVTRGGYAPPCVADLTGDGQIDSGDLGAFIDAFLTQQGLAELTGDGQVDSGDIAAFLVAFLAGCP